jgi:hypothetical protein
VVDQFWGGGVEEAHWGGLYAMEGIGGGENTPASQSRGHRLGRSGWGGNTWWRGIRGVVDSTEERLERAVSGGTHRAGRSGSEGPEGLSGLELEEVAVWQRVVGGGGARWTGVRRSASAWHEEKQRRGMSEGKG